MKSSMKVAKIYTLKCPLTQEVRYVGKSNNPQQRLTEHINNNGTSTSYKREWISNLRSLGLKPILEIVSELSLGVDWREEEKRFIKYYKDLGCNLVNTSSGGNGLGFGNQTSFKSGNNAVRVVVLDLNGKLVNIFESLLKTKEFCKNKGGLDIALSLKSKTYNGYIVLREDDYRSYDSYIMEAIVKDASDYSKKGIKSRWKKNQTPWNKGLSYRNHKSDKIIYQYSSLTGKYINSFSSARTVSEFFKINRDSITSCCKGNKLTVGGYIWSYDLVDKLSPIIYQGKTNNKIKNKLK